MKKQPSNWIEGMAMELKEKRHQMKDPLQELMTITMEECGELIQQCSKAIRCGNYYDNTELLEEVADVYTMLELMHEYDLISFNDVDILVERKKEKLKKWSNLL
tara:strand:- start:566 stop:877 length:312 start_codon:yes stop_codon:yes gene_type:complete